MPCETSVGMGAEVFDRIEGALLLAAPPGRGLEAGAAAPAPPAPT